MSHETKLLLKVIQQRIIPKIDREVSRLQKGFRPGLRTREGIIEWRNISTFEMATVPNTEDLCSVKLSNIFKHFQDTVEETIPWCRATGLLGTQATCGTCGSVCAEGWAQTCSITGFGIVQRRTTEGESILEGQLF